MLFRVHLGKTTMRKNKIRLSAALVFVSFLAFGPNPSTAVSLGFTPNDQTVEHGQKATVDVFALDLASDLVGTFEPGPFN